MPGPGPGIGGAFEVSPARGPAGSGLGGELVDADRQARLAAGGGVLVDDALRHGRVDALERALQAIAGIVGAGLGGGDRCLRARLQLGAHRLVPLAADLVLLVALDLALDVGHGGNSLLERWISRDRLAAPPTARRHGAAPPAGRRSRSPARRAATP